MPNVRLQSAVAALALASAAASAQGRDTTKVRDVQFDTAAARRLLHGVHSDVRVRYDRFTDTTVVYVIAPHALLVRQIYVGGLHILPPDVGLVALFMFAGKRLRAAPSTVFIAVDMEWVTESEAPINPSGGPMIFLVDGSGRYRSYAAFYLPSASAADLASGFLAHEHYVASVPVRDFRKIAAGRKVELALPAVSGELTRLGLEELGTLAWASYPDSLVKR